MISIIIPIYNGEKYIEETLKSALSQTYEDIEIILVNDGSTDKSLEICKKFQTKDKRIKIITQSNQGLSSARNTGINNSSGEYLFFLDADDILDIDILKIMYSQIKENKMNLVIANNSKFINQIEKRKSKENYEIKEYTKKSYLEEIFILEKNTYACFTLIPKIFFNDIKFPIGKYFEDMATMYKLILKAENIIYINEVLAWYRQHEGSIVSFMNEKKAKDYIEAVDKMCECINKIIPELSKKSNVIQCYCRIAVIERGEKFKDQEFINIQYDFVKKNIKKARDEVKNLTQKIKFKLFEISPKIYFYINKLKNNITKGERK